MATKRKRPASKATAPDPASSDSAGPDSAAHVSTGADELYAAALERGGDALTTGRFLMTFKEGAADAGVKALQSRSGLRVAHARDFKDQAVVMAEAAGADAIVFPEINVALLGGAAAATHGLTAEMSMAADDPFHSVDPEYFVFATGVNPSDYMRGVLHTAQMIVRDLGWEEEGGAALAEVGVEVAGVTWGLTACRVPPSSRDGSGIQVAVLDTGFDLGHPEFAGRAITSQTFVGQPVQDLHGHGTHTTGTACGPNAPAGAVQRYGVAFRAKIFSGKVLTNAGNGTQAQSLAGINWAIANKCAVISMSLGAKAGVQPSYTSAGQAALNAGCLIVAAAGNSGPGPTEAPANSPTIMSVAAVDINLKQAPFSCVGKVEISGPGVNVFSSFPRPGLHTTMSGTSMATPHVAGCAALWAQTSANLRGPTLRAKLISTAKALPFPATKVGAGLV
ncbi:MAG: S8 family serine peptidase [Candidatus Solibacter sp.]